MKRGTRLVVLLAALLSCRGSGPAEGPRPAPEPAALAPYARVERPDPDGIGKSYLGREIAQVMGHQAAAWLERESRAVEELPDRVVEELALRPADIVADLGAGTGYFSFRMSPRLPEGKVLAVEIQPELLEIIRATALAKGVTNVEPVLGSETDPRLPEGGVDLVLLVDVYHELSYPQEVMAAVARALRPGGRVVLIEYRGEDPAVPIKRLHKMTVEQARRELGEVGLRLREAKEFLPWQHFLVFEKE